MYFLGNTTKGFTSFKCVVKLVCDVFLGDLAGAPDNIAYIEKTFKEATGNVWYMMRHQKNIISIVRLIHVIHRRCGMVFLMN